MRLRWVTVNDREVIRVAWQSWPDEIYYVKCSLPSTSDPLVCVCVCVCVCINTLHTAAWEFHPAPHMYEDTALSLSLSHTHTHTHTHVHTHTGKVNFPRCSMKEACVVWLYFPPHSVDSVNTSQHSWKQVRQELEGKNYPQTWFCNALLIPAG